MTGESDEGESDDEAECNSRLDQGVGDNGKRPPPVVTLNLSKCDGSVNVMLQQTQRDAMLQHDVPDFA